MLIWDGVDFEELSSLLSADGVVCEGTEDGEDGDNQQDRSALEQIGQPDVAIGLLLCEDSFYQLKALPVAQALSFYYLRHSLSHRMVPNAMTVPRRAQILVAAMELADLSGCHGLVGSVCGFSHAPLDEAQHDWFKNSFPYKLQGYRKRFLTAPTEVLGLDYQSYNYPSSVWSGRVPFLSSGRCDAVVMWVDYDLAEGVSLCQLTECGNDFKRYSNKASVLFLEKSVEVKATSQSLQVITRFKFGDSDIRLEVSVCDTENEQS